MFLTIFNERMSSTETKKDEKNEFNIFKQKSISHARFFRSSHVRVFSLSHWIRSLTF